MRCMVVMHSPASRGSILNVKSGEGARDVAACVVGAAGSAVGSGTSAVEAPGSGGSSLRTATGALAAGGWYGSDLGRGCRLLIWLGSGSCSGTSMGITVELPVMWLQLQIQVDNYSRGVGLS